MNVRSSASGGPRGQAGNIRPGSPAGPRPEAASAFHPAVSFPEFDKFVPHVLDLPGGHGRFRVQEQLRELLAEE